MAATTGGSQSEATPVGRKVLIVALDGLGKPAGAVIQVFLNGFPAGTLSLGSGTSDPISLAVSDARALIELRASFSGETRIESLPPGRDNVSFQFSGAILRAMSRKSVAYCPDGTSGSPCVTCSGAGGVTWTMCC